MAHEGTVDARPGRLVAMLLVGAFLHGACAWASVMQQDDRVAWLSSNAIAVRSIDIYGKDLSDLAPLKAAIGDARVVLLGEQTHGDGACFAAKSRLVKFLHQELGFDVLAWESGMDEMRRVDRAFAAGTSVEKAHEIGLFGIWALSQQCRELLTYAKESHTTARPLTMAGFDDQLTTAPPLTPFPQDIVAFFGAADDKMLSPQQRAAPGAVFKWLDTKEGPDKPAQPPELESLREMVALMDRGRAKLEAKHGKLDIAFQQRALGNVVSYIERMKPGIDLTNHRDKRMAENLVWLANEYFTGRKIIVWAASMHNARRIEPIEWVQGGKKYIGSRPMGDYAFDALGKDLYSIMFVAYEGRVGRPWTGAGPIDRAPEGSLDDLLHKTGKPYLFLDLRGLAPGHWLREPIVARPLGYAPMKAIWPDSFDAVFFTDRMYPSTRIGVEPEDARPR